MDKKKGWSQWPRSVEECAIILRSLDTRTLQRRAERLSIEAVIETSVEFHMENRTSLLMDEAGACFTNGQYTGCVLTLATGVEHGLRELLNQPMKIKLNKLILIGVEAGVINDAEVGVLRVLKNFRNQMAHSDIDELAAGTVLWRQAVNLTVSGMESNSAWEKIIPECQDHKEVASSLAAERKAGDLLVKVREVMHDIVDRHYPAPQSPDIQD